MIINKDLLDVGLRINKVTHQDTSRINTYKGKVAMDVCPHSAAGSKITEILETTS